MWLVRWIGKRHWRGLEATACGILTLLFVLGAILLIIGYFRGYYGDSNPGRAIVFITIFLALGLLAAGQIAYAIYYFLPRISLEHHPIIQYILLCWWLFGLGAVTVFLVFSTLLLGFAGSKAIPWLLGLSLPGLITSAVTWVGIWRRLRALKHSSAFRQSAQWIDLLHWQVRFTPLHPSIGDVRTREYRISDLPVTVAASLIFMGLGTFCWLGLLAGLTPWIPFVAGLVLVPIALPSTLIPAYKMLSLVEVLADKSMAVRAKRLKQRLFGPLLRFRKKSRE